MPVEKLKRFLDDNGVKYVVIRHSPAFTAQEVAASAHIPGKELAKTVLVRIDGRLAMAVLPASYQVDFGLLAGVAKAGKVELASEDDFRDCFPGCELGAMPPFGNLFGMEVYADESLADDEEIAFSAGTHSELIRLRYEDFIRLSGAKVARISTAY
ncbi:MAG: deacylase [Candidatus Dadabacteria bacterium]|nr:MAG: deacylase [Candidatus Dadabacteria bacterium]